MNRTDWLTVLSVLLASLVVATILVVVFDFHQHDAIVIVAMVGAAASVVNTGLIQHQRRRFEEEVRTENGGSVGSLLDALAARFFANENKLDAIEVEVREARAELAEYVDKDEAEMRAIGTMVQEHIERAAPVVAFVENLMPKEGGK